jgi:hypothetical protein
VTPTTCKALIDAGYEVTVERSTQRIFDGKICLMDSKLMLGAVVFALTSILASDFVLDFADLFPSIDDEFAKVRTPHLQMQRA